MSVYNPPNALPSHASKRDLANRFSKFFDEKIKTIRVALDLATPATISVNINNTRHCESNLCDFQLLSCEEVLKIIKHSQVKTCSLDPLPAPLTKDVLVELLPCITAIVNKSLQSGVFPDCLKRALVTPLLKKTGLDVEEMKNFRPVSNLPFLGKIIERAAISQFQSYMMNNDLYSNNQSAYRKSHSVETALVKVNNDLLQAVDNHGEAVLVLLDMSAAFDTVDHKILLRRLQERYGVNGTAHKWFSSYLDNRHQSVLIDGEQSDPMTIAWGMPQGSVVGPEMFVAYSAPIEDIVNGHNLCSMSYADDTQLYVLIKPSNRISMLSNLENCILDIRTWLTINKLMLNESRYAKSVPKDISLTISNATITSSPESP